MIAKKVPMRSVGKSDYRGLVQYLTDKQGKRERLGYVTVSNCHSEEWQVAVLEVLNTQARNTRAVSDKTYHLIVSFRAGEEPDDATLKAIEGRICDGLGYREHQRVCVVHHDTDNLHLHIAINKIHPTRHTIHDPYYDHTVLGILCERLEREYDLEGDNHHALKGGSENRAADMEHHTGVQSLLGWIKRGCAEQMEQAQSWAELHAVMSRNGLQLKERGNGLVITDGAGLGVKASSISRSLSKTRLEKRLGTYQPADEVGGLAASGHRYQVQPLAARVDTSELYTRYREERQTNNSIREAEKSNVGEHRKRLIESAKERAQVKRKVLKAFRGTRAAKKLLYGMLDKVLKDEIRRINRQCLAQRLAVDRRCARRSWADWLRAKAIKGDSDALDALRARDTAGGLKGDTITGKARGKIARNRAEQDNVTKKGTIIYRVGSTAVRDDGDKLKVSRGCSLEGLQAALHLAMEHFGSCLAVNGTDTFKEQVARAAALGQLPIVFADPGLERRRRELLSSGTVREKNNGQYRERSDVTDGWERTGAEADHGVGRDSLGTAGITAGEAAANQYVAEREAMRLKASGVPRHRRYDPTSGDTTVFAGMRQVAGQMLALLKHDDEIMVLPVDAGTARRLKRVAIGELLTVTAKGVVAKAKGRKIW